jgi:tRNA uridine 5-carboxymethylaminomethyl modification enzyme
MDDLVTKTPVEPYRMFTSRAEHRLVLRSDNSAERLTAWADEAGLLSGASGEKRRARFQERRGATAELEQVIDASREGDVPMDRVIRQASFEVTGLARWVREKDGALAARCERVGVIEHVFAERRYAPYIVRQGAEIKRHALMEHRVIPASLDHTLLVSMRTEARAALARFRPRTFGQAGRLEGITPADLTLLAVLVGQHGARRGGGEVRE